MIFGEFMVFSSLEFLFLFLPIGLSTVYIAPRRFRNAAILFVSLVFYAWGGLFHLPLMLLCIAVNFALGILIFSASGKALLGVFFLSHSHKKYHLFSQKNVDFCKLNITFNRLIVVVAEF